MTFLYFFTSFLFYFCEYSLFHCLLSLPASRWRKLAACAQFKILFTSPTQHYCALPPSLLERGNGGEDSAGASLQLVPNSKFKIHNLPIPLALFRGNRSQRLFYNIFGFFGRTFAFPTLTKCRYKIRTGFARIVQPVSYAILHILCLVSFQFI